LKTDKIMWTDEAGTIHIDEDRMNAWFVSAIQNLKEIEATKEEAAWLIFLMGAETVYRANGEDIKGEA